MRDIDRAFLILFKDLKITTDKQHSTEDKPVYLCYIGKQTISHNDVIGLVKKYQDEIVKMLTNDSSEE